MPGKANGTGNRSIFIAFIVAVAKVVVLGVIERELADPGRSPRSDPLRHAHRPAAGLRAGEIFRHVAVEIQRLKKRKLALKDEILTIKNRLLPDIIA